MIKIHHSGCILCAGCASVCPTGALELVGTRIKFYPEKCISCGACVRICPANVIELVKEKKEGEQ
ncbi:4Fe-4S binding protein [Candidatus Micrarchaeota archaeon]|nr:4Fe-4S binding protein [Candidatus Micrarchaeota archaeon]